VLLASPSPERLGREALLVEKGDGGRRTMQVRACDNPSAEERGQGRISEPSLTLTQAYRKPQCRKT
jgi:hypothetical protein